MASQVPSYAVCKPLMPAPSASSFLNKPRTDCPVLDSAIVSSPALAQLMATGLARTEHSAVRPQPLLGLEGSQCSAGEGRVRYLPLLPGHWRLDRETDRNSVVKGWGIPLAEARQAYQHKPAHGKVVLNVVDGGVR
jgi:hypothetical protein